MKNIAKKSNTLNILNKYQLKATKKFGQNFLVDVPTIQRIVDVADITKETLVIEVGPGIGALTEQLALKAKQVIAFEIDERLKYVLEDTLSEHDNITIIFKDFLKVNLEELLADIDYQDICVVTNLPYYITSDIITKVVTSHTPINRMIAMVQKEVAQKLCSDEKSPLTLIIDYVGSISYKMTVSKNIFIPAPHVDSAVIRINKEKNIDNELIEIIEGAFKQKRKTILNNMKPFFKNPNEVLERCQISPQKRAQQLELNDFILLANERVNYED